MSADLKLHASCLKGTDFPEDNKVPDSVQWRPKNYLVNLFCICGSKRKTGSHI